MSKISSSSAPESDSDSEGEVHEDAEFEFVKCGKATVDSALVAVSRFRIQDLLGHEEMDAMSEDDDTPELACCNKLFFSFDQMESIVAILLYWVTLIVQFTLLYYFYRDWIEIGEDPWEKSYQEGIILALENATILRASLMTAQSYNATQALFHCQSDRSPPFVHLMCLWLWFGTAMLHFFQATYRFYIVWKMSSGKRHTAKEPGLDPPPGERQIRVNVSYMSCGEKVFATLFILLPNWFMAGFVGWCGVKYVSVVVEVNLLVKAAMKMNFIARMDKIVFPCFVSYNWENYISASSFKVRSVFNEDSWGGWLTGRWPSTIVKTILGLVLGWFCSQAVWPQVEDYRMLCKNYFDLFPWENTLPAPKPPPPVSFTNDNEWYPNI